MSIQLVLGIIKGELYVFCLTPSTPHGLMCVRGMNYAYSRVMIREMRAGDRAAAKLAPDRARRFGKSMGTWYSFRESNLQFARDVITRSRGRILNEEQAAKIFPGKPVFPGFVERSA